MNLSKSGIQVKHIALHKDSAKLNAVNDWAERGVKLVSDFAGTLLEKALYTLNNTLQVVEKKKKKKTLILPRSANLQRKRRTKLSKCGDYLLVGRCWTSCNLFPIRNLAVSQHAPSILQFLIFFPSFPTFYYFVYHLLLSPGTDRFFRNRRCDFQQSNVAMLEFCLFCIHVNSRACSK